MNSLSSELKRVLCIWSWFSVVVDKCLTTTGSADCRKKSYFDNYSCAIEHHCWTLPTHDLMVLPLFCNQPPSRLDMSRGGLHNTRHHITGHQADLTTRQMRGNFAIGGWNCQLSDSLVVFWLIYDSSTSAVQQMYCSDCRVCVWLRESKVKYFCNRE